METNKIYNENCIDTMSRMPDNFIDLTITSPPYDDLRNYNGYSFEFEKVSKELLRVTKPGGTVVWIVSDATINGCETGTSFKQALFFKSIGFNILDTMIWNKGSFSAVGALFTRYAPVFEYMFIFTKGKIKTFNPIKDRLNKTAGKYVNAGNPRDKEGKVKKGKPHIVPEYGQRFNIWEQTPHQGKSYHPAVFPRLLVKDHILSWSNEEDLVYDCFGGSGTTAVMCKKLKRNWILSEISKDYCDIAEKILRTVE